MSSNSTETKEGEELLIFQRDTKTVQKIGKLFTDIIKLKDISDRLATRVDTQKEFLKTGEKLYQLRQHLQTLLSQYSDSVAEYLFSVFDKLNISDLKKIEIIEKRKLRIAASKKKPTMSNSSSTTTSSNPSLEDIGDLFKVIIDLKDANDERSCQKLVILRQQLQMQLSYLSDAMSDHIFSLYDGDNLSGLDKTDILEKRKLRMSESTKSTTKLTLHHQNAYDYLLQFHTKSVLPIKYKTIIIKSLLKGPDWFEDRKKSCALSAKSAMVNLFNQKYSNESDSDSTVSFDSVTGEDHPKYDNGFKRITSRSCNWPYSNSNLDKIEKALPTNYTFDIGFKLLQGYNLFQCCRCPCSKTMAFWREANGLYMDENDNCCKETLMHAEGLLEHLKNGKGFFHRFVLSFLQSLYQVGWINKSKFEKIGHPATAKTRAKGNARTALDNFVKYDIHFNFDDILSAHEEYFKSSNKSKQSSSTKQSSTEPTATPKKQAKYTKNESITSSKIKKSSKESISTTNVKANESKDESTKSSNKPALKVGYNTSVWHDHGHKKAYWEPPNRKGNNFYGPASNQKFYPKCLNPSSNNQPYRGGFYRDEYIADYNRNQFGRREYFRGTGNAWVGQSNAQLQRPDHPRHQSEKLIKNDNVSNVASVNPNSQVARDIRNQSSYSTSNVRPRENSTSQVGSESRNKSHSTCSNAAKVYDEKSSSGNKRFSETSSLTDVTFESKKLKVSSSDDPRKTNSGIISFANPTELITKETKEQRSKRKSKKRFDKKSEPHLINSLIKAGILDESFRKIIQSEVNFKVWNDEKKSYQRCTFKVISCSYSTYPPSIDFVQWRLKPWYTRSELVISNDLLKRGALADRLNICEKCIELPQYVAECDKNKDDNLDYSHDHSKIVFQIRNEIKSCNDSIATSKLNEDEITPISSERIPKGDADFYYIIGSKIHHRSVNGERIYKTEFQIDFPTSIAAFASNPNVNCKLDRNSTGFLSMLHKADGTIVLAIMIHSEYNSGLYLEWMGNHKGLSMKSFSNFNHNIIKEYWKLNKILYDEVQGTFVSQVFGDRSPLCKSQEEYNMKPYFTVSPNGPDLYDTPNSETIDMLYNLCKINYKLYDVIYCLDLGISSRTKCKKEKTLAFATGTTSKLCNGYSTMEFVDIDIEKIKKIPPSLPLVDFKDLIHQLTKKKAYRYLIPPTNSNVRIKLVSKQEYDKLLILKTISSIQFDQFNFLVGKEIGDLNNTDNSGVLLSAIGVDESIMNVTQKIDFDTIRMFQRVYGNGFNRKCCKHIGFATYRGPKNSNRPNPSPFVDDNEVTEHQYYNSSQNTCPLGQVYTEKLISDLGENAMRFGRRENMDLFDIIDNSCTKAILTIGHTKNYVKQKPLKRNIQCFVKLSDNSNKNYLGFSSTKHVDVCDSLCNGETTKDFRRSCKSDYDKAFYDVIGPAMPTVCQYKHVWNNTSDTSKYIVNSCFMFDGLGICQPLNDKISIMFLGSTFLHSTSFCYLNDESNKYVITRNEDDVFIMLAWGKTGGAKDRKRKMRERELI